MIEAVLLTFIYAWFKFKWKTFNIFKHWSIYPIVLTCLFNIYIIYLMTHGQYWFIEYAEYIKITSLFFYCGLIYEYKLYDISLFKKIKVEDKPILTTLTSPVSLGVIFIIIGSILNTLAVRANNFTMPVFANVSFSTGYSKIDMFNKMSQYGDFHVFGDYASHLIFLTDVIDFFGISIFSIGDVFIRLFACIIIYYSLKTINKNGC